MRLLDLTGKTFGRWAVVSRGPNTEQGQATWCCRCECGTEKTIQGNALRSGTSRSCGCLTVEANVRRTKHGHCSGPKPSTTYFTWAGMVARCTNPGNSHFPHYGGRGIKVCERWQTFENFLADMGEKPGPRMSVERIDNSKGYSPENCRWATDAEQARNRRNNRHLTLGRKTQTMADWAEELGIHPATLSDRVRTGMTDQEALTSPVRRFNGKPLTYRGETHTIAEWARILDVPVQMLYQRFHRGWPVGRILSV